MKTAVVILNWNGKQLLERFLPSVIAYSSEALIYVADNASTDDSISFLKTFYPEIKIIQNKENGGFAKGYNDALKQVNAEIFVLLNSDVEVTQNWLTPVLNHLKKHSEVVAAQPKILDYKNKNHFEYAGAAGGFIDKFGYPFCRGRIFNTIEEDKGQYNDIISIFWASGACFFVKSAAFWEAGGFDEDYFAHQEEIDLCWRFHNKNQKVSYVGTSSVYHLGGATLKNSNPKKTFLNFRNSLFSILKNAPRKQLFYLIFVRMLLDGFAAAQFLLSLQPLHFLAIGKAHFSFYIHFKKIYCKRMNNKQIDKYYNLYLLLYLYFFKDKKHFNSL